MNKINIKASKVKILVVDDEVDLKRLISQRFRKQVKSQEFEFLFANDGEEALSMIGSDQSIDLVLTDLNMPKMDGLTLLRCLSKVDTTLKSVVISAYGDMPNIRTAMNEGAFDFITKPIDFQDLAITIDKTLEVVHRSREQQNQLQQALKNLECQAFYDELTSLPNQNHLTGRIRQCMEWLNQRNSPFAVLFVHIESFKLIKYGLGHKYSDQLVVEMAKRLKSTVTSIDTVARISFDEFSVLISDVEELDIIENVTSKIYNVLSEDITLNQSIISPKVYIGVVHSSNPFTMPEDFLRAADTAMHAAKISSTQNTMMFQVSMQTRVTQRLQLEADLRIALGTDQLLLNYQPIVHLTTGKISGFEALIRWKHPQRGWISPVEFIPMAEETGLILPLGEWILQEACRQFQAFRETYSDLDFISVNLSGVQLWDDKITDLIADTLQETGLPPEMLKLEITETILMERGASAVKHLNQLRDLGVRLSIDDFGMGYSSLAYLQTFPINTLKIDQSFVNGVEQRRKDFEIAQIIVTLAHALGLDVVAEGLETPEQVKILQTLGCEYAQGYLFSRPLLPEKIVELLDKKDPFPEWESLESAVISE